MMCFAGVITPDLPILLNKAYGENSCACAVVVVEAALDPVSSYQTTRLCCHCVVQIG